MRVGATFGTRHGQPHAPLLSRPSLRGSDEQLADAAATRRAGSDERSDVGDRTGCVDRDVARDAHESERLVLLINGQKHITVIAADSRESRCDVAHFGWMLELREQLGDRAGVVCASFAY